MYLLESNTQRELQIKSMLEGLYTLLSNHSEKEIKELIKTKILKSKEAKLKSLKEFFESTFMQKNLTKIIYGVNLAVFPLFLYNCFCYFQLFGFYYKKSPKP